MSDFDEVDGTMPSVNMAHRKPGFEAPNMKERVQTTQDSGLGSLGSMSLHSSTSSGFNSMTADMNRLELADQIYNRQNKCEPIIEQEGGYFSADLTNPSNLQDEKPQIASETQIQGTVESLFVQDTDGDTKLHIAIAHRVSSVAKRIIEMTPSPDYLNRPNVQKLTPLHLAVLTNQADVARHLVRHGALLEARDEDGNTALHLACYQGLQGCVAALTQPLSSSEAASTLSTFQQIPQDLDIKNYEGYTCMHLAAQHRQVDVLGYLYSRSIGGDVNARDGLSGRTVLHHVADVGDAELAHVMAVNFGANVNATAYNGCTALQLAAGRGHHHVMRVLMEAGGDQISSPSSSETSDSSDDEQMDSFDDFQIHTQAVATTNNS